MGQGMGQGVGQVRTWVVCGSGQCVGQGVGQAYWLLWSSS